MTISSIYRFWQYIHIALDNDIEKLIIFDEWPAFKHLTNFANIKHFLILQCCCTIWQYRKINDISPIDNVTIFSILLIILLLMTSAINPFMTISSYSKISMCLTISHIFRSISFPPIYHDFVHFRPFPIIKLMSFPSISPIWANYA